MFTNFTKVKKKEKKDISRMKSYVFNLQYVTLIYNIYEKA